MHSTRSAAFPSPCSPIRALAVSSLLLALCSAISTGCSTAQRQGERPSEKDKDAASTPAQASPEDATRAQLAEFKAALMTLTNRLDSMETRMGTLSDRVAGSQHSMDMLMANRKALPAPVAAHPSQGTGAEPQVAVADNDPEAGFVADAAIQEYRKGSILLEAQKYPEAILEFSSFVERYPDHPLAGSAQFGIGKSYF
jgi:TolA-binding protein